MNRREFLCASAALPAVPLIGDPSATRAKARIVLRPFDYRGVRLLPGMFSKHVERTRETYFNLSNDDVLKGFRQQAGQPAPGKGLDG